MAAIFRSRKAYKLKKFKRRLKRGIGFKSYKRIYNMHKFKRLGLDCQIAAGSVAAGTVNLVTLASGWALGTPQIDVNGTYQYGGAMQFQLDQCLEFIELTRLFDRYKITGVKVTIIPLGTATTNAAPATIASTNYPTIAIATDNDDASLPSSWNEVAVKQNVRIARMDKPLSIYIHKPKLADTVYNGITNGYRVGTGYLNSDAAGVPHYGLKFWMRECPLPIATNAGNGSNVLFRVVTKFYLSMKDAL